MLLQIFIIDCYDCSAAGETHGLAGCAGHKANYRCPRGIQMVDHDPQHLIQQLAMPAGSVMFFADGALVHGTTPWLNPIPRRTILNKYSSRSFNRSGGELVAPENRWGESVVEGMSESMMAVMRGPDRDVFNANVPRLVVSENGVIDVSLERGKALYSAETPLAAPVARL